MKQDSHTCPEDMGQTRDFSHPHGAPVAGELCSEGKEVGLEEGCIPRVSVPVGVHRLSMHARPCVPICCTQHVLHQHVHL